MLINLEYNYYMKPIYTHTMYNNNPHKNIIINKDSITLYKNSIDWDYILSGKHISKSRINENYLRIGINIFITY